MLRLGNGGEPFGRFWVIRMETLRPKVSVGLPVYNGERSVPNALTRFLEQDFEDFELIVSDNASTHETQEICRTFAEKAPRICYFWNETNIGLAANHNLMFENVAAPLPDWRSESTAKSSLTRSHMNPRVPLAITTFNRLAYLCETLSSMLAVGHGRAEL